MKKLYPSILLLAFSLALTGCGQKGPLELNQPTAEAAKSVEQDSEKEPTTD